jgi:hypothetical protein
MLQALTNKKIKRILSKINLSRFTAEKRTEELSNNTEESLKMKAPNFQLFSMAMYESTDVSERAQLAVFVRGVNMEFNITEELGALMPMT